MNNFHRTYHIAEKLYTQVGTSHFTEEKVHSQINYAYPLPFMTVSNVNKTIKKEGNFDEKHIQNIESKQANIQRSYTIHCTIFYLLFIYILPES